MRELYTFTQIWQAFFCKKSDFFVKKWKLSADGTLVGTIGAVVGGVAVGAGLGAAKVGAIGTIVAGAAIGAGDGAATVCAVGVVVALSQCEGAENQGEDDAFHDNV